MTEEIRTDNTEVIANACKKIAELEAQIEKMKRCEICNEYTSGSCNYHSCSQQVCKENGMKLFKLKEIKEK